MIRTLGAAADDVTVVRPRLRLRPRLILKNAGGGTREVQLTELDVTIGRATTCDVVLTNAEVSRLHARIIARGEDHVLVPIGARRNTYVNGELTLEERLLRHGDMIRLAAEEFVYADAEQSPAAARQAPTERTGRSRGFALASAAIVALAALVGVLVVRMSRTPEVPEKPVPIPAPPPARVPAPAVAPVPEAKVNDDVRPPGPPARPDTSDRLAKLLYQGDIAFVENRYTTPPDESALYFYREALKLDPQNARARSQVALIIDRYLEWAERALAGNDRARARLFADKAAYAHEEVGDVGNGADIERRLDLLSRRVGSFTKK
ncbi:MAG: FHA domain-containing protein [Deltaproteobacteria bacterium]|nr:FHA domain-containing protein [Deltaproteobacteria bacterium]